MQEKRDQSGQLLRYFYGVSYSTFSGYGRLSRREGGAQEAPTEKVIFIVDDDDLVRDLICTKLAHAGYRAEGYGDPSAFLAIAGSLHDGCIVLDLDMPEMSGLEVQSRLAELGCTLPVIFYSGKAGVRHAVDGMRAGAVDFLQKSAEVEPLIGAIQKLIGKPFPGTEAQQVS